MSSISGIIPLVLAAMLGNVGAATTLIELGADASVIIDGETGTYSIGDLARRSGVSIPGLKCRSI